MNSIRLISHNQHCWNNRKVILADFSSVSDLVFIQEQWLLPENLYLICSLNNNWDCHAVSGIVDIERYGMRGDRPYGGTCFMWNKSAGLIVKLIGVDDLHRVMAIEVVIGKKTFVIVGVYLPCYANNDDYECDKMTCVGFIESVYNVYQNDMNCALIMTGDFNVDCSKIVKCDRLSCLRSLLAEYNMTDCEKLDVNYVGYTYRQESLQQYTLIDHMFICDNDLQLVKEYNVIDSGSNV